MFTAKFSSGQSLTASVPSSMASVSRFGLATLPQSRWSRPITMGAFTSPFATISLKRSPALARSPRPSQQMRAGKPWKATRSCAMRIQRASDLSCGNNFNTASSVARMSAGSPESATQRNGPRPVQNCGRMYAGTKPGNANALVKPASRARWRMLLP